MREAIERVLLNDYQREFPLVPNPFQIIAESVGSEEIKILVKFKRYQESGIISRIGPVFRPNTIGASTLAAISVPESQLVAVAGIISAFNEVNHNYEREHHFNLWFVVNSETVEKLDAVLTDIERATGYAVMSLPLQRDYYINLGFDLDFGAAVSLGSTGPSRAAEVSDAYKAPTTGHRKDFISALQAGLPLSRRPYAEVGELTGMSENTVCRLIANMLHSGAIKRFGVVVRHHELGYRANAMCVWDISDAVVDGFGEHLAKIPYVTLCYRRPRCLPHWPYNLFAMIHGKDRSTVVAQIERLVEDFDLHHVSRDVLFSGRRFKQRGAYYRPCIDLDGSHIHADYG